MYDSFSPKFGKVKIWEIYTVSFLIASVNRSSVEHQDMETNKKTNEFVVNESSLYEITPLIVVLNVIVDWSFSTCHPYDIDAGFAL